MEADTENPSATHLDQRDLVLRKLASRLYGLVLAFLDPGSSAVGCLARRVRLDQP